MSTNLAYLSPRAWVHSPIAAAWALSVSIDDAGSSSCRSCLRAQKARPAAWLASEGEKNRYRKSSSVGTGLPATWKTLGRSEEGRVGKECVSTCSSRGSQDH